MASSPFPVDGTGICLYIYRYFHGLTLISLFMISVLFYRFPPCSVGALTFSSFQLHNHPQLVAKEPFDAFHTSIVLGEVQLSEGTSMFIGASVNILMLGQLWNQKNLAWLSKAEVIYQDLWLIWMKNYYLCQNLCRCGPSTSVFFFFFFLLPPCLLLFLFPHLLFLLLPRRRGGGGVETLGLATSQG